MTPKMLLAGQKGAGSFHPPTIQTLSSKVDGGGRGPKAGSQPGADIQLFAGVGAPPPPRGG